MRWCRHSGALLLLLLLCAAPLVACVGEKAGMSSAEQACCRMMSNHCGDMGMPASHTCCRTTPSAAEHHALQVRRPALHPVVFTPSALAADAARSAFLPGERPREAHRAPPESPPPAITILRL